MMTKKGPSGMFGIQPWFIMDKLNLLFNKQKKTAARYCAFPPAAPPPASQPGKPARQGSPVSDMPEPIPLTALHPYQFLSAG
jgi:hypothetical protein